MQQWLGTVAVHLPRVPSSSSGRAGRFPAAKIDPQQQRGSWLVARSLASLRVEYSSKGAHFRVILEAAHTAPNAQSQPAAQCPAVLLDVDLLDSWAAVKLVPSCNLLMISHALPLIGPGACSIHRQTVTTLLRLHAATSASCCASLRAHLVTCVCCHIACRSCAFDLPQPWMSRLELGGTFKLLLTFSIAQQKVASASRSKNPCPCSQVLQGMLQAAMAQGSQPFAVTESLTAHTAPCPLNLSPPESASRERGDTAMLQPSDPCINACQLVSMPGSHQQGQGQPEVLLPQQQPPVCTPQPPDDDGTGLSPLTEEEKALQAAIEVRLRPRLNFEVVGHLGFSHIRSRNMLELKFTLTPDLSEAFEYLFSHFYMPLT